METPVSIPTSFYLVVGILVVANLGVIITMVTFIFKAGLFVARTEAGIAKANDCAIRAHKRIDKIAGEAEA